VRARRSLEFRRVGGGPGLAFPTLMLLHQREVLSPQECARLVAAIYSARADWTPNFEAVQFTLGRAYYTHLEEGLAENYFSAARASDALVERHLPGLQARMLAILSALVGAQVARRDGWCGPGVHIFPAGGWLAQHGGDIHFDTEGLQPAELSAHAPALSCVVMLQPPHAGGGLRVWDARYPRDAEVEPTPEVPSVTAEYRPGDLVAIDSYRLHQIQPFQGARDRISATAHVVWTGRRWEAWF
jgi:hypothetical protein